jgi:hypothetical protein
VPPVVVGPPAYAPYYYPPAYYPPYYASPYYPPPAGYAQATPVPPPQQQADAGQGGQVAYGATCYAGVYVCPAPSSTAIGAGCSCPALGAPSYGTVH